MLVLIGLFTAIACHHAERRIELTHNQNFEAKTSLKIKNRVQFDLDSLTSPLVNTLQPYQKNGRNYLIYLNEEANSLYINSIKTRKILMKIDLKKYATGKRKEFQGFYYHSPDSIFLYSFKPRILLVDSLGNLRREYTLAGKVDDDEIKKLTYRALWSSTTTPSLLYGDTLFSNSMLLGGSRKFDKKIQLLLNIKTGQCKIGALSVPQTYKEHNFGDVNYDMYSVCVNDQNQLVYSFPGYEKLIKYNLQEEKTENFQAESKYISYFVEYEKSLYDRAKPKEALEYFMTTSCYGAVYYDPFKNIYYRIALLPVVEKFANYGRKRAPQKRISIVVLNSDFKYLCELQLEKDKYKMFSGFVSADGLNIQNITDDDATMDFTTFALDRR